MDWWEEYVLDDFRIFYISSAKPYHIQIIRKTQTDSSKKLREVENFLQSGKHGSNVHVNLGQLIKFRE
jgi:hypothetical protein